MRVRVALGLTVAMAVPAGTAGAHSGGLDANGGHYCREAGYESGSCSPLNSYHCHESGCTDYDGETGSGGSDSGGGGGDGSGDDVYEPAKSANSGNTMPARRMFRGLVQARERRAQSYDRDEFPHWGDANGDGCDTRQAVLISESRIRALRTGDCTVTAGSWVSMYDGGTWTDPSDVDIDHVVALAEAWRSGAYGWTRQTRRRFANDLAFRPSLRAVTDNVNQSKGARDPSEWLPARARCAYAISWVQVKYRWRLRVNGPERRTLSGLLDGACGDRMVVVPWRAR